MSKILILDGNNLCHRAFHAMRGLTHRGEKTGAIFGFLNILSGNAGKFKPEKIFVCWDDGRNKYRMKLLPTYKDRQPKLDMDYESFHKQKHTIIKLCYYLGIPQLIYPDREADDFIYSLVKKYSKNPKNRIVIASGDKDFRQLVNNKVLVNDETQGLITPLNFKRLFGILPEQYSAYLALMGDHSDKIPGIGGCGEKTALKLIQNKEPLPFNKNKIFERNLRLIDLKEFDEQFGPFKLRYFKDKSKPTPKPEKYLKLCAKFGIRKFITDDFLAKIL